MLIPFWYILNLSIKILLTKLKVMIICGHHFDDLMISHFFYICQEDSYILLFTCKFIERSFYYSLERLSIETNKGIQPNNNSHLYTL
nr:MAG TPA: hypothetical protein [Caudoviricetes sp.]